MNLAQIVSGKKVTYIAIPDPQLHPIVQSLTGARAAGCVIEMYRGIREVGCKYFFPVTHTRESR